jgi:uncharacterized protein with HEPN domain
MLLYAAQAVEAARGRSRAALDGDLILTAALERFVEIVGEAASRVSEPTRAALPGVQWREIVGMRNRIVHGYGAVDRDVLWDVVEVDLPRLVEVLVTFLGERGGGER